MTPPQKVTEGQSQAYSVVYMNWSDNLPRTAQMILFPATPGVREVPQM
jgi:hypothetical protein